MLPLANVLTAGSSSHGTEYWNHTVRLACQGRCTTPKDSSALFVPSTTPCCDSTNSDKSHLSSDSVCFLSLSISCICAPSAPPAAAPAFAAFAFPPADPALAPAAPPGLMLVSPIPPASPGLMPASPPPDTPRAWPLPVATSAAASPFEKTGVFAGWEREREEGGGGGVGCKKEAFLFVAWGRNFRTRHHVLHGGWRFQRCCYLSSVLNTIRYLEGQHARPNARGTAVKPRPS